MDYKNSNASGSQAGGLYQLAVALNILIVKLTHVDAKIGIETIDDVTISDSKNHISLGQVKHTVNASSNPLNDLNKNLWKTMAIWLSYIKSNPSENNLSFLLLTNGSVGTDTLAQKLSDATTPDIITALIAELKKYKSADKDTQAMIDEITTYEVPYLEKLIKNITLVRIDQADEESIRQESISCLPVPEHCDRAGIYNQLLGWFTTEVYERWKAKEKAWISRGAFSNQVYQCLESSNGHGVIGGDEISSIIDDEVDNHKNERFVEHLIFVDLPTTTIKTAINNRLKYTLTRLSSVKRGKTSTVFWEDVETELRNEWDNKRQETENLSSDSEKIDRKGMGRRIYHRTISRSGNILGKEVVGHVIPGLYHELADFDKVWWHPDFPTIQKDDGS